MSALDAFQGEIRAYRSEVRGATSAAGAPGPTGGALLLRVPTPKYPTISAALAAAQSGSTILVRAVAGAFLEALEIPSGLTGLRLLADTTGRRRRRPVLDGGGFRAVGVTVDAAGVRIRGFRIQNFVEAGVRVSTKVGGVRILDSVIQRIVRGPGVDLALASGGCLVYRSTCRRCGDSGMKISGKDHYAVGNSCSFNARYGIEATSFGNHILSNRFRGNGVGDCLDAQGNTIFYDNELGGELFLDGLGTSCVALNRVASSGPADDEAGPRRPVAVTAASRDNTCLENDLGGASLLALPTAAGQLWLENRARLAVVLSAHNLVVRNALAARGLVVRDGTHTTVAVQNACGRTSCAAAPCPHTVVRVRSGESISAAVGSAGPGTTIVVEDGTYAESVRVPPGKDGLRLLAAGGGARLVPGGSDAAGRTGFDVWSSHVTVSGFRVRGFRGAGIAVTASLGARLLGNRVSRVPGGHGIVLNKTFSVLLSENSVSRAGGNGISITGMNTWCLGNRAVRCGGAGISMEETNTFGNAVVDNVVRLNRGDGILDHAGPNLLLRNTASGNGGSGIREAPGGAGFASILENVASANARYGVELATGMNYLAQNLLSDNRLGAIHRQSADTPSIPSSS